MECFTKMNKNIIFLIALVANITVTEATQEEIFSFPTFTDPSESPDAKEVRSPEEDVLAVCNTAITSFDQLPPNIEGKSINHWSIFQFLVCVTPNGIEVHDKFGDIIFRLPWCR